MRGPTRDRPTTIRVLLVDDQELVRTGFRMILEDVPDIEVVGEAADGAAAVTRPPRLRRTSSSWTSGCRSWTASRRPAASSARRARPDVRVLVLTTFDADEHVVEALRAGACGFLLKDVTPAEFVDAIRTVAAGDALLAPSVTRRLLDRSRSAAAGAPRRATPRLRELTERETEVLTLIARGLSNREIADGLVLAEPTVKTHVSHVLDKLELRDRAQAVVLAYEAGLVRPGSIDAPGGPADRYHGMSRRRVGRTRRGRRFGPRG